MRDAAAAELAVDASTRQRYSSCAELAEDLQWQGLANRSLSFLEGGPGA